MSEEQKYIVVSLEDDSDKSNADDDDVIVIIGDSESDISANDSSTIEPNFQGCDNNCQLQSEMEYGAAEGVVIQGGQTAPQMNHQANLKRGNCKSMDLPPPKRGQPSSPPRENNTSLQGRIENTNRQINQLGIVSRMQHCWENPLMQNCQGNCHPSLLEERQATHHQDNCGVPCLQLVACSEQQQPEPSQGSLVPRIVSSYSLQSCFRPESSSAGVTIVSPIFNGGAESSNTVLSSAQPAAEVLPVLPPENPRCPEEMNYSPILGNEDMIAEMPGIEENSFRNNSVAMNDPTVLGNDRAQDSAHLSVFFHNFDMPGAAESILQNNPVMTSFPVTVANDSGQYSSSSSASASPDSAPEKFILIEIPEKSEVNMEGNGQTMHYPALLGHFVAPDPGTLLASIFVTERVIMLEMPVNREGILANALQILNNPTAWGNDGDQDPASSPLFIPANFGMSGGTGLEMNPQMICNPVFLENDNGQATHSSNAIPPSLAPEDVVPIQLFKVESGPEMIPEEVNCINVMENGSEQDNSASFFINPDFAPEDVVPIQLFKVESGPEMIPEEVNCINVMENGSEQDNSAPFFINPGFAPEDVVPIQLFKVESGPEMIPEEVNCINVMENGSEQDNSAPFFINPGFGYLGNPRRNIQILSSHLMAAQKKTRPWYAACYLVRVLFSKKILICSAAGENSLGRPLLDPNKMAAIREYLALTFPNYDLRECGKDWETCISDIDSLIRYLCNEAKRLSTKTVGRRQDSASRNTHTSANWNAGSNDDGGEGHSQQMRASKTRKTWNSKNAKANPKVTDDETVSPYALEYLGNPSRNIRLPYLVTDIAKAKFRVELSARYLIRHLFTEDVLIKSNVYGNLFHGICPLDPNRIGALREFLQDNFPSCDLTENGFHWKLCVSAINSCIRGLRYDLKRSAAKLQMFQATTSPSTESEPRDPDVTNSST